MSNFINTIKAKVISISDGTLVGEENAMKEIAQELILTELAKADFFKVAAFHGGTFLRIVEKLNRFSEDLDFIAMSKLDDFRWEKYIENILLDLNKKGFNFLASYKKPNSNVIKVTMSENAIASAVLQENSAYTQQGKKIKIKLEIDIDPPKKSSFQIVKVNSIDGECDILTQDLASAFAGKLHAVLCRTHFYGSGAVKGRVYYDLDWYLKKGVTPNFPHLSEALNQAGPWAKMNIQVTFQWLLNKLLSKIQETNWDSIKADVTPFLSLSENEAFSQKCNETYFSKIAIAAFSLKAK